MCVYVCMYVCVCKRGSKFDHNGLINMEKRKERE